MLETSDFDSEKVTAAASPADERTIAIVGAGFSGTAVAIHLLRGLSPGRLRIILIDPRAEVGAGIAYAARDYPYPLNVAAGQMSLDPARPEDFLDYARTIGIQAQLGDYLPRQVYGDYLRARFEQARAGSPGTRCEHRRAAALQLRRLADGRFRIWFDDGGELLVHDVVLALGNAPPATPPALDDLAGTAHYLRDPWSLGDLAGQHIQGVLLLGSGLTMIDAALRLAAIRPRLRRIYVLSRHGWLPQSQAVHAVRAQKPDIAAVIEKPGGSIRALFSSLRRNADEVARAGGDWREVVAGARGLVPETWHKLDGTQRERFLRHVRALWDVHRHRVPAGPLSAVQSLVRLGVLEVHAGRLVEARALDDAVEIVWRPRGATRTRAWLVDRVVNCTGPDSGAQRSRDPLVQSLLAGGLIRCDSCSLGIEIAPDGRVIGRDGLPVDRLHYIGPWLRARDWEATAVPELRSHAVKLAARLLADKQVASC